MDCGDCIGEKSGGVAGAGVYVSPLVVRLPVLRSRLRERRQVVTSVARLGDLLPFGLLLRVTCGALLLV